MEDKSHIEAVQEEAALYALGALPPKDAELFETRLRAACPMCRAELARSEQTLAAVALGAPQASAPPDLRARLLDRVRAEAGAAQPGQTESTVVRADDTAWEASPVPGVQFRPLLGTRTLLVRMGPKTHYPAHHHPVAEQCLVLEGSVTSDGVTAYAGDYVYMPAGSMHKPLYSEQGCLFLLAYT